MMASLTFSCHGYPTKKALDPRRAYNVNRSSGSNREGPASGSVQAESGSSAASNPILRSVPQEKPKYIQPSAKMEPVPAVHSSNTFAAPVYSGHDSFPASSSKSFQVPQTKDGGVEHSGTLYGTTSSSLPFSSGSKLPGLTNPSPQSALVQPGDTSYRAKMYDRGSYESETEERPPSEYTPFRATTRFPVGSMLRFGPFVDGFWFGHPYLDRVLLTRKYPLGTYKLSSNTFEHGKNHWHDTIIVDNPTSPSTQQSNTFSEGIKQSSQPAQSGKAG
ncbi:uncharacterized protein LOC121633888 isoform X2 [Melanotaenia boesemani]|uniref:uncharacterized protein LOC121633888 isoform X2 n=1 Tax=Melanotaenia boesemani TaxID=1250792 RepID=UPI001C05289D|nr:uncharacterized protein LOC121633888 isoform X2 [Melanotaenia boesemani]